MSIQLLFIPLCVYYGHDFHALFFGVIIVCKWRYGLCAYITSQETRQRHGGRGARVSNWTEGWMDGYGRKRDSSTIQLEHNKYSARMLIITVTDGLATQTVPEEDLRHSLIYLYRRRPYQPGSGLLVHIPSAPSHCLEPFICKDWGGETRRWMK